MSAKGESQDMILEVLASVPREAFANVLYQRVEDSASLKGNALKMHQMIINTMLRLNIDVSDYLKLFFEKNTSSLKFENKRSSEELVLRLGKVKDGDTLIRFHLLPYIARYGQFITVSYKNKELILTLSPFRKPKS